MTKAAWTVATCLLLLAVPLAGCTDLPFDGGDGGGAGGDDDLQPGPVSRDDCDRVWYVRNYTYNDGYVPRTNGSQVGHDVDRADCWVNWNQTDRDRARVYFVFAREAGTGTWEFTVYDADGEVFRHEVVDPWGVHCNERGVEAPMGNWTIVHELSNFTGRLTARLCLDPPPDDCFNQCP